MDPTPATKTGATGAGNRRRAATLGLAAVLLVGAAVRVLYLWQLRTDPMPESASQNEAFDEYRFRTAAEDIRATHGLGSPTFYAAGYPYLIAALQSVFPPTITTVFVFQILAGLVLVLLLHRTGRLLFDSEAAGLVAAFIGALYAPSLFQECDLDRGTLVALANLAGLYALARGLKDRQRRWFFIGGLCWGSSMALRPNVLPFAAAVFLLVAVKQPWPVRWRWVGLVLLGTLLIVAPLVVRNRLLGAGWTLETQGPDAFWVGNTHDSPGIGLMWLPSQQALARESHGSWPATLRLLGREIGRHPAEYGRLYARKFKMFFNGYEAPGNLSFDLARRNHRALRLAGFTFVLVSPLALLGLAVASRNHAGTRLLAWLAIVLSGLTILFHIQGRYRYPAVPLFMVLAAGAVCWLARQVRSHRWIPLAGGAAALAALAVWTWPDQRIITRYLGGPIRHIDYGNLAAAYIDRAQAPGSSAAERPRLWAGAALNLYRAIQVKPDEWQYYTPLGISLYHLGQLDAARKILQRVVATDPRDRQAQAVLRLIEEKSGPHSPASGPD